MGDEGCEGRLGEGFEQNPEGEADRWTLLIESALLTGIGRRGLPSNEGTGELAAGVFDMDTA
jgi:hypothetical protein